MPASAGDALQLPRYSGSVALARSIVLCVAAIGVVSPDAASAEPGERSSGTNWSYLYDGGALPFVWGTLGVALGFRIFVDPPDTPRLFSEDEGGAMPEDDTVPEAAVAAYVIVGMGALVAVPVRDRVRAYHLKGYAETVMTTAALTEMAKAIFGRHRPTWTASNPDDDLRRSFFSGHSSFTFATSTYLMLYLHGHVLASWREPGQAFAWWEVLPLGGLAAGSFAVAASRLGDSRHHRSDVITGAAVGTGMATLFYWWQEARYRRSVARDEGPAATALGAERLPWLAGLRIVPTLDNPGVLVMAVW
jgi:membrane-associated phospholipid phosphatase